MIYVFNKNKIISCVVCGILVLFLFAVGTRKIPNQDAELIKVVSNHIVNNSFKNYIKNEK